MNYVSDPYHMSDAQPVHASWFSKIRPALQYGMVALTFLFSYFGTQSFLPSYNNGPAPRMPEAFGYALPFVPNNVFHSGEAFHYGVVYKGIPVGQASLFVKEGP